MKIKLLVVISMFILMLSGCRKDEEVQEKEDYGLLSITFDNEMTFFSDLVDMSKDNDPYYRQYENGDEWDCNDLRCVLYIEDENHGTLTLEYYPNLEIFSFLTRSDSDSLVPLNRVYVKADTLKGEMTHNIHIFNSSCDFSLERYTCNDTELEDNISSIIDVFIVKIKSET